MPQAQTAGWCCHRHPRNRGCLSCEWNHLKAHTLTQLVVMMAMGCMGLYLLQEHLNAVLHVVAYLLNSVVVDI